jgi:hypothetical protein
MFVFKYILYKKIDIINFINRCKLLINKNGEFMISSDRYCHQNSIKTPKEQSASFGFIAVELRCAAIKFEMVQQKTCRVISEITGNENNSINYTLHEKYNNERISATKTAYKYFGDNLLAPTVNNLQEKYLDETFKQETEDRLLGNKTLLNASGDDFGGFCAFLSLQFIKKFFKLKEKTPEALRKIGERFIDGGKKKIATQQKSELQRTKTNGTQIISNDKIISEANETINNLTKENCAKDDFKKKQYIEHLKKLTINIEEINNTLVTFDKQVKKLYGLQTIYVPNKTIDSTQNVIDDSSEKTPLATFTTDSLEPGAYVIFSSSRKERENNPFAPGHATTYIKCETGPNYLYEPNLGTVQIPPGKDVEYITLCLKFVDCDQLYLTQYKPVTANNSSSL